MTPTSSTIAVDVGYCGVHQAFQCALAAQERGWLRSFYCSLYDAPGKWGGLASLCLGSEVLRNRRVGGLDPRHVNEYPWPWICDALHRRFGAQTESMAMFKSFDEHCARNLVRQPPDLFVSTERCALKSLQVAARLGIHTIHDCPQLHPMELESLMRHASDACGLPWGGFPDGKAMKERKLQEYELADRLMVYSEFHRQSFVRQGVAPERLFQNPLWVDTEFWRPAASAKRSVNSTCTLNLLFAGELSIRKGLPFLFQALELLDAPVRLTLVGRPTDEVLVPSRIGRAEIISLGPLTKRRLRELYTEQDLLVLPSIADSFGFVALEAMACGLPVLLSENCGVPVPEPGWRVPALDSRAIATRIQHYLDKPERILNDASSCYAFALQFSPERFRDRMKAEYLKSLA